MRKLKSIVLLILALLVCVTAFAACGDNSTDTDDTAHEHSYVDGKCECGESDPNYVPPHEHSFVDGKCECGESDPNYVPPHEHSYESSVTAPTCTEAGFTTYTCACGDSYTGDEVAATGHSYGSEVTAPTCTEAGFTTYTCSACDDSYTGDEVAATGHKFIDGVCVCGEEYVAPLAPWILVTELKDGDKVLIGAAAYGKLLSAEKVSATSYYNKGVDYSENNFENVTDAEIFTVSVNENGEYTFTSNTGVIIALAASYSSLNADGEHKTWTLTDRGDGTFLVKNIGRNTYLEWYASKNNWSTYTSGNTAEYYLSFYLMTGSEGEGEHVHNYISNAVANTCTEDGYTTFTCACGDTYKEAGEAAKGHSYVPTVTAPTCEEDGYTTYTCACGDSYKEAGEAAKGHTYVDGFCTCGKEDPALHVHEYQDVVTKEATCKEAGSKTPTCVCGDTLDAVEIPMLEHVDANLDIDCDREGCTGKVAPKADSVLSTFTANNLGAKISTSASYYVVGNIAEVLDAKNGIFLLDDGTGEKFYFRLPKNADGLAYSSWTSGKIIVGDKVQIYGKINKYSTSSAPNGQYWPAIQGGVVTVLEHTHAFSDATCVKDSVCLCGEAGTAALGHIDEDSTGLCDRCDWNMNLKVDNIVIATDTTLSNGVLDETSTFWTWAGEDFDVIISKGKSTFSLYKTAKAYMQLKKQNLFTLTNKNGATIDYVVIKVTSTTYLTNLEQAIGEQYKYTSNTEELSLTIKLGNAGNFEFENLGANTVYISGIEVVYEKAN